MTTEIATYDDLKLAIADNEKNQQLLETKHQELIELRNSKFKKESFAQIKQECENLPKFPFKSK